jgi:hypothetical protein
LHERSAHREEFAQSPHDAGEHDLADRIRPPNGGDNANFGVGTGRSEALCLAASAIIQEMFILTRVLCSAGGDRVESDAGSKKFVDPLGVSRSRYQRWRDI